MNHLHHKEEGKQDTLEEHIFCNRIFARALSFLLKEEDGKNEGVIVDLDGRKYIVHTDTNQVKVSSFDENVPEGTFIWFHKEEKEDIAQTEEYKEFCRNNGFDPETDNGIQDYLHAKWVADSANKGESEIEKAIENIKSNNSQ